MSGSIPDVFSNWINLQYLSIGDINNTGSHNNFTGALDLSSNALLNLCWLDNNDISALTINNGNNTSIYEFNTLNNPNLTCIFVDDAAYSAANWTQIDATTSFVETQAECDQLAVEKNALIALYNSTDGPNWTDSTNWNTSAPVNDWFGVTVEGNQVVNITLTSNNLVGTLPAELGDLSGLQTLNLYDNQISGTIPIEIGNCTSLTYLSLANNLLSGSIPTELGNLLDIEILSLSNNQLTGTIPAEIGNLLDIELLSLSNNQITGVIPAEIGNCNKLTGLGLSNNQLSGSIPVEFANLTLITNLTLYANQLTGDIPDVFTNWTDLGQIHLETDFWGTFPNTNNFTGTLDLSNNVNLFACLIENTSISTLKLNNGNNTIINFLYAQNNPNLTCIFVDDAAYSTTNWTNIDTTATFVETQAECEALGLEDESLSQSITLYPNPTNGILNISSNNSITFKEVNVVNLYGQTVMESSFTETLDMSHLSNGVYFVNLVTQSNNKTTYKIIKQ